MEIALKIACKIKSNERFSVYIIIPMWPEGNPTEMATQRILYWQVILHKFPYLWFSFGTYLKKRKDNDGTKQNILFFKDNIY